MAKKKRSRRSGFGSQQMYKLIRLAALLLPAGARVLENTDGRTKLVRILNDYTGYNINSQDFKFERLANGYLPVLAASAITYAIPKINGMIRRL